MPGHSRPKDGVASLATAIRRTASLRSPMVPGIHAFLRRQDVDGRDKHGHDQLRESLRAYAKVIDEIDAGD